jgi:CheY-like chemotaxis protein
MANPFKVLVVDDEPDIVRYPAVLRRLGHEPVGAGDGEEAIQKALNDRPSSST